MFVRHSIHYSKNLIPSEYCYEMSFCKNKFTPKYLVNNKFYNKTIGPFEKLEKETL